MRRTSAGAALQWQPVRRRAAPATDGRLHRQILRWQAQAGGAEAGGKAVQGRCIPDDGSNESRRLPCGHTLRPRNTAARNSQRRAVAYTDTTPRRELQLDAATSCCRVCTVRMYMHCKQQREARAAQMRRGLMIDYQSNGATAYPPHSAPLHLCTCIASHCSNRENHRLACCMCCTCRSVTCCMPVRLPGALHHAAGRLLLCSCCVPEVAVRDAPQELPISVGTAVGEAHRLSFQCAPARYRHPKLLVYTCSTTGLVCSWLKLGMPSLEDADHSAVPHQPLM